ncbi:hypothetical protein BS47DRAFT_1364603, partial [Hydnum rufescens UP504]
MLPLGKNTASHSMSEVDQNLGQGSGPLGRRLAHGCVQAQSGGTKVSSNQVDTLRGQTPSAPPICLKRNHDSCPRKDPYFHSHNSQHLLYLHLAQYHIVASIRTLPSPRETMHTPSSYQGNGTNTLGCLGTKVDGLDNTLKQFQERVKVFQKIISAMDKIVKGKRKGKGRAEDKDPHHGDFLAITSAAFYKMMDANGTKDLPDLLPNGDYWIDHDGDEYLRPNWKKDWKGANDAWEFPLINF